MSDISLSAGTSLNLAESLQDLTVNGNSDPGAQITVVLNQITYTTSADENGVWSLAIPAADLQQLNDENQTLTITATDASGNVTTNTSTTLDVAFRTLPELTLDTPFGDGRINAIEAQADGTLSGNLNIDNAASVTVTVNGTAYAATLNGDGTLVPGSAIGITADAARR
ncbi:Ig-like domain-containing protein [Pantoea ananatis]